MLPKFSPSSGHKMNENGCFRPLSEKVVVLYNSNSVCTLIRWLFRTDTLFGHVGQILALYRPQNDWKWWFLTIIWKSFHPISVKLGVYTYCVSIQNWFGFRPLWPNFGPLVATKLLNMVVYDHYLKKLWHNSIQTWCVHLFGDCSELLCFSATLAKFWPSSGHKMAENCGFQQLSEKVLM